MQQIPEAPVPRMPPVRLWEYHSYVENTSHTEYALVMVKGEKERWRDDRLRPIIGKVMRR